MAIPGKASTAVEIRAKVRVGEKNEKGFPRSLSYFVSDDLEVPPGESSLDIVFVHAEPEDAFRTGLEWWRGKLLACYSDEGGDDPTAFRVSNIEVKEGGGKKTLNLLDADDVKRGEPVGQGRTPIACRFRSCKHFGTNAQNKECRVKGRLTFLLPGGRTDAALQFETKGWNTIESLSATLASCRRSGPLNAPGREFVLSVVMEQSGTSRFPVVSISEKGVKVEVNSLEQADAADALVQLRKIVETDGAAESEVKLRIFAVLDLTNPGWREDQPMIAAIRARVEELGVVGAAKALLAKYETAMAV